MYKGWISIVLVVAKFLKPIGGQESSPVIYPRAENQSAELNPPVVTSTISTISTIKRNDWWPPSAPEIVTQTSPYTELQQPIPPTYYVPGKLFFAINIIIILN